MIHASITGKSFGLALTLGVSAVGLSGAALAQDVAKYRIEWGQKIKMRDGVELNATVYVPLDAKEKLPAVLNITPYVADGRNDVCDNFASNNFVCVAVDVRGRGNSDGKFIPWQNDAQDGYDTVEEVAKLPWVDGRVVMNGGSYAGFNQWATASTRPPSLKAIAPVAAVFPSHDYPNGANVPFYYDMMWLSLTSGRTDNSKLFGNSAFWGSVLERHFKDMAAFKDLDKYAGNTSTVFQDWVANPKLNSYWDAFTPTAAQYAAIDLPVLTITGSYDGDQGGALNYYRQFNANASAASKAKQNLIIGPWDHAGTRIAKQVVGGVDFGAASVIDVPALHVEWYNWVLRGGKKPAFLDAPVKWYETGSNKWNSAPSVAKVHNRTQDLYLTPGTQGSSSLFASGSLSVVPAKTDKIDSYVNDPKDMKYADIPVDLAAEAYTDQRDVSMINEDGLIYHSNVFAKDMVIAGWPRFEADVAMTTKDADILVRLYEILPGGTSIILSSDILRARYRKGFRTEELMTPGKFEPMKFERFTWFSRKITKGSRLRLVINSPNGNGYQKNFQGGGVVADETGKDAQASTISIKADTAKLSLPIAEQSVTKPAD
jgi:uncharacterized protein